MPTRRTALTSAPEIATDRLLLRAATLADFEPCFAMTADPDVGRYIGGAVTERSVKWEKFLRIPAMWTLLGYGFWIVEERATGAVLGEMGFGDFQRTIDPPLPDWPEMGWVFGKAAHGRGIASEAVAAALRWAGEAMPGVPVQAIIDPPNRASCRLAQRMGFAAQGDRIFKGAPVTHYVRPADIAAV
jgi:RimJ/RimL family protein N-acetyltransferase